ncbi:hypothetical protein DFH08DRAFT_931112 [Mycena albidolilacea]|uniref:F-box domain-containing protein n=1 Tax=Mycena albidolilacea TaxID=1033008 RepID=A0AAD7AJE9_9AGAR|nr:hypothetical protein DFH08DRAFT_931112 [Mycena albidolilacea]
MSSAPIPYLAIIPSEIWLACWTLCSTRQLRRLSLVCLLFRSLCLRLLFQTQSVDTIDLTRGDWITNVHKLHRAAVRLERISDGPRVQMVRSWTFAANRELVSTSGFYSHIINIGMVGAVYERVVTAFSSTLGRYQNLCSLNIRELLIDRSFRDTLVSLPILEEVTLGSCDIPARDGVLLDLKFLSMYNTGSQRTKDLSEESLELVSPGRLQTLKIDGRGDTIPLMTGFGGQKFFHLTQLSLDTIFDLNLFLRFLTSIDAPLDLVRALTPNRPVHEVIVRPGRSLSAEVLTFALLDISKVSIPVRSLALPSTYPTLESLTTISSLFPGLTSLSMEIDCEERMRFRCGGTFDWTPEVDTRVPDVCDAGAFDSLPPEEVSDAEEEQPSPAVHVASETHPKMPDSVRLHEILSWICNGLVSLPAEIEVLRFPVRSYCSESTELSEGHQHRVVAALSRMYPSLRELEMGYHNNPHWERNGVLWKSKGVNLYIQNPMNGLWNSGAAATGSEILGPEVPPPTQRSAGITCKADYYATRVGGLHMQRLRRGRTTAMKRNPRTGSESTHGSGIHDSALDIAARRRSVTIERTTIHSQGGTALVVHLTQGRHHVWQESRPEGERGT